MNYTLLNLYCDLSSIRVDAEHDSIWIRSSGGATVSIQLDKNTICALRVALDNVDEYINEKAG